MTNLRKVCDRAKDRGLKIAMEPLNRFETNLVNITEDVTRLLADINHCVAKIIHVQVSENYRGTPGISQPRWDAYFRELGSIKYQGMVTIERVTPEIQELGGTVCMRCPLLLGARIVLQKKDCNF